MIKATILTGLLLVTSIGFAQTPLVPGGSNGLQSSATVQGNVVKLGSGEALPGTRVSLAKQDGASSGQTATTESDGSFTFQNVGPGIYRLLSSRNDGYLPAEYGQPRPNVRGRAITITSGQTLKGLKLEMAGPSSITGKVYDTDGEPVGQAQVQALKSYYKDGKRLMTIAQSVQSNDQGEYRLFWLSPGTYFITARPVDTGTRSVAAYMRRPEDSGIHEETSPPVLGKKVLESGETVERVYVPVFHPGTLDPLKATPLTLNSGDSVQGVDITLTEMPVARKIRGKMIDGETGQPIAKGSVRAIAKNTGPNITLISATTTELGAFELSGLVPGTYDVFGLVGNTPFGGGRNGSQTVEVEANDIDNITIVVPPTINLAGQVSIEGQAEVDITRLRISFLRVPSTFGLPQAQTPAQLGPDQQNMITSDGKFTMTDVGAGDYRINVFYTGQAITSGPVAFLLPSSVYVKEARLGSTDILDKDFHLEKSSDGPLELLLASDPGVVSGNVVTDANDPVPNCIVALIPEEPQRYRSSLYKSLATDTNGKFTFRSIPPGNYKLFAFESVETGAWFDPEFIQSFDVRGTVVRVQPNGSSATPLALIKTRGGQ